jgi:hypothetical protein
MLDGQGHLDAIRGGFEQMDAGVGDAWTANDPR